MAAATFSAADQLALAAGTALRDGTEYAQAPYAAWPPAQPRAGVSGTGASRWWLLTLALAVVLAAAGGAYYLYRSYFVQPTDAEIMRSIQAKFAADPNLSKCSTNLNSAPAAANVTNPVQGLAPALSSPFVPCALVIKSDKGVVSFIGRVSRPSDKEAAIRIAGQQRGVKQVEAFNLVAVDPRTDPSLWIDQLLALESRNTPQQGITGSGAGRPAIVKAVVQGGNELMLPHGDLHLYGMVTGGGRPSGPFAQGQFAQAATVSGNLAVALAYGMNDQNSYTTETMYHNVGGVSISGPWNDFHAFYGVNPNVGAHTASATFQVTEYSLVVIIGLASSQQYVSFEGIPGLQVDVPPSDPAMSIAHAYLPPGTYAVVEHSMDTAPGQTPANMADLVGVFVFGSR
jgi:hypothetical protein